MPFADHDGARLFWRTSGHRDRPVLLLLNSLGTDMTMWDGVVPALSATHCLLRLDMRGHGASSATPGDYTLAQLAGDVLAVMDAAGVARAAICGLSLGGMVAQFIAAQHPARCAALIVCNSSAAMPAAPWDDRARLVRDSGLAAIAGMVMQRFFAPEFRAGEPPVLGSMLAALLATEPVGYAGCCCAIRDMSIIDAIATIAVPTLVINGTHDVATPGPEHSAVIAARIPGARLLDLPTGHISAVEAPGAFAAAVAGFLAAV